VGQSTIQIPNEIIQPIVEAKVTAAITEALGGYDRLIETAVAQVLNQKVNNEGVPSNYSDARPWFKWVMTDCVKKAARTAVEDYFKDHAELIKKAITTELSKKNSPLIKQLVSTLIGSVVNADALRYRMNVSVSIEDKH
jgi:hypothetical protein